MYEVDEKDEVQKIKDVPQSSVGAPLPVVLSDEHKLLLAYLLENTPEGWDGSWVRVVDSSTEGEPIALIEFERYESFTFGPPNDEAFHGHPLYEQELEPYSVFEIKNSSWIRKLERMNSVHEYHNAKRYERLKHYVFAFHDSTFECIAEGFKVSIYEGSLMNLLKTMQEKLI